ncbi:DUF559 domain-containing protein [Serinicoccus profundi]|uniref:DUF559 domain-containing protein n=1 Tax=Serinicoccus profundi TaxID=1078471 RepID=UPI000255E6A1|nr:DUF559 domain-containing protein [Serinicoccus profundi]
MDSPARLLIATQLLDAHGGVVSSEALLGAGLTYNDIHALGKAEIVLRLRRHVLVDRRRWEAAPTWARHDLRARAFAIALPDLGWHPGDIVLSCHSALALYRIDIYGTDDLVHASRVEHGRGRRSEGVWVHAPVPRAQVSRVDGVPVASPALASLQVAALYGVEPGLVAADSALRDGHCTREELSACIDLTCLKNGRPAARVVTELADGRRESAGESRTGWVLHTLDVPRAIPQVVIRDRAGVFVARADFGLEGTRVLVEFDGRLKYEDRADLIAEKRREDRLRELGYEVVRLTWEDLAHPQRVLAKIRAALARDLRRRAS